MGVRPSSSSSAMAIDELLGDAFRSVKRVEDHISDIEALAVVADYVSFLARNLADIDAWVETISGPSYTSVVDGLAATQPGETFLVDNGDGTLTVYMNEAGVAVALRTIIPSPTLIGHLHSKANASALGISGGANSLGSFTGNLLPDNATLKQALQQLANNVPLKASVAEARALNNDTKFITPYTLSQAIDGVASIDVPTVPIEPGGSYPPGSLGDLLTTIVDDTTDLALGQNNINDALTTLTNDHGDLIGVVDALATLRASGDATLATLIVSESSERTTEDQALAAKIDVIGAANGDNSAFILDINRVKVSPTESLADRLTALEAGGGSDVSALVARITAEETARANADSAEATARTTLGAGLASDIGTLSAALVAETQARVDADGAETTARTNMATQFWDDTTAAISAEATARSNADGAFTQLFSLLGSKNAGATAFILDTTKTRVSAGETLAQRLSTITSDIGSASASVTSEATTRASADTALNSRIDTVVSRVDNVTASITNEAAARVANDDAIVWTMSRIGAVDEASGAFLINKNTVQLGGGETLGSRLDSINASIGGVSSSITNETNARVTAVSSVANAVSALNTTVNGHTASINAYATSLNGINAKMGVRLDVNGYITGYEQNNNGSSGSFNIHTDFFVISKPGGGQRTEYSGGNWRVYDGNGVLRVRMGVW